VGSISRGKILMKIAVFGSKGRLGNILAKNLSEQGHQIVQISRDNFDIDKFLIEMQIFETNFDLIINTIALTDVNECEINPEMAMKINANFPLAIARFCDLYKIKLIHISTDYVFSGNGSGKYSELSAPEPICQYGKSKLQGELNVLSVGENRNLVIRTAWLLDFYKRNFLTWILNEFESNEKEINVISDQYGSPTSTIFLAQKIIEIINSEANQILHITNFGQASWFEMAHEVAKIKGFSANRLVPISINSLKQIAPRPKNTSMISVKNEIYNLNLSLKWEDSLKQILQEPRVLI
jgi:dTDP-4-dehydrorhamnose reductase